MDRPSCFLFENADTVLESYPAYRPLAQRMAEWWRRPTRWLRARSGEIVDPTLPDLSQDAVVENVGKVLDPGAILDDVCSWLWRLVAQPLLTAAETNEHLRDTATWAVLIPTGLLGTRPLHAATDGERTLDDTRPALRASTQTHA